MCAFFDLNRYLEAVEAIVKSQTKGSPYYNIVFLERLKEMTERLAGSSLLIVTGYVLGSWLLLTKRQQSLFMLGHIY